MILAVDASGVVAVVALATTAGDLHFGATGANPRAHAEELAPLVRQALARGTPQRVVAGRGPGSFTGLRVGLVFAQVFGWARGLPVSGVSSLDVVARQYALVDGWVVLDARRREVYLGRYRSGRPDAAPRVVTRDEARAAIGTETAVGDVALLTDTDRRAVGTTRLTPASLAQCAAATRGRGSLQPDYLRRPDITWSPAKQGAPPP